MTFENLQKVVEGSFIGDEWNLKSSSYMFGFKCINLFDEKVIAFGGYGTHISIWNVEHNSSLVIARGIVEHIKEYDSDVNEFITLDECEMV